MSTTPPEGPKDPELLIVPPVAPRDRGTMHLYLGDVHIPATRDGLRRCFLREQKQGRLTDVTYEQWITEQLQRIGATELTDEAVVTLATQYGGLYREYLPFGRPRQPVEPIPAAQDDHEPAHRSLSSAESSAKTDDEGGPALSEAEGCCMSPESAPEPAASLSSTPQRRTLSSVLAGWMERLRRR